MKAAATALWTAFIIAFSACGASAATIQATFWDAPGTFGTVDDAIAYAQANAATATFDSTLVDYPGQGDTVRSGRTTLADFLGPDAASLSGAHNTRLNTSVFHFTADLYLFPGNYQITVGSDDGYRLTFDDVLVSERVRPRAFRPTTLALEVAGPVTFDLWYFENRGKTGVVFTIDGEVVSSQGLVPVSLPGSMPLMAGGLLLAGLIGGLTRRSQQGG